MSYGSVNLVSPGPVPAPAAAAAAVSRGNSWDLHPAFGRPSSGGGGRPGRMGGFLGQMENCVFSAVATLVVGLKFWLSSAVTIFL
jgi:hypothetical protein